MPENGACVLHPLPSPNDDEIPYQMITDTIIRINNWISGKFDSVSKSYDELMSRVLKAPDTMQPEQFGSKRKIAEQIKELHELENQVSSLYNIFVLESNNRRSLLTEIEQKLHSNNPTTSNYEDEEKVDSSSSILPGNHAVIAAQILNDYHKFISGGMVKQEKLDPLSTQEEYPYAIENVDLISQDFGYNSQDNIGAEKVVSASLSEINDEMERSYPEVDSVGENVQIETIPPLVNDSNFDYDDGVPSYPPNSFLYSPKTQSNLISRQQPHSFDIMEHFSQIDPEDIRGVYPHVESAIKSRTRSNKSKSGEVENISGAEASEDRNLDVSGEEKYQIDNGINECLVCLKQYSTRKGLLRHVREKHGSGKQVTKERKFACDVCDKKFMSQYYLGVHKATHDGNKTECPVCHKKFCSVGYLNIHMKSHANIVSENEEIPSQSISNAVSNSLDDWQAVKSTVQIIEYHHKRPNSDVGMQVQARKQKKVACNIRKKALKSSVASSDATGLKSQIKTMQVEKDIGCKFCPEKFRSQVLLRQHVLSTHSSMFERQKRIL